MDSSITIPKRKLFQKGFLRISPEILFVSKFDLARPI